MKIAIIASLFAERNMKINAAQKIKIYIVFNAKKRWFRKFNLDLKSQ